MIKLPGFYGGGMAQNTDGIISKYLDKLEMMIDTDFIGKIWDVNKDAYDFKTGKEVPAVYHDATLSMVNDKDWPSFAYNDAFSDKGKMLLNQMG